MSMNSKLSDAGALATSALAILRVIDSLRRLPTSTAIFFAAMMIPPPWLSELQCTAGGKIAEYGWLPLMCAQNQFIRSMSASAHNCRPKTRTSYASLLSCAVDAGTRCQRRSARTAASGIGRQLHQPGNIMNILARHGRALLCSTGIIVLGLLAACGGGGDHGRDPILGLPSANVVIVTVTPATAALPVAGTLQLTAVANYADGSSHDVTATSAWTSATPAVATVSANGGLASGVAAGSS